MLIVSSDREFDRLCVLLLGGFDGLHLGHRFMLDLAKREKLPVGITTIFGGKGESLFTREEREFLFERAGIDFVIEYEFTEEFMGLSPEKFCKMLFSRLKPKYVFCGEDFRFGRGAAGDRHLLQSLSPCPIRVVPPINSDNLRAEFGIPHKKKFSTSACKEHLLEGKLELLNACLKTDDFYGSAYFIQGIVEHGREEGRKFGFPTVNLGVPAHKLLPPDGVYGGLTTTEEGDFPSIINIGARPTFGVGERKIESHLIGFEGDLYGTTIRIYPTEFLRPIRTFSSPEELRIQLRKDKERYCK